MKIDKYMKRHVISIRIDQSVMDAIDLFVAHPIGMLPVIDANMRLTGILTINTILHLAMPESFDLVNDIEFLHDLGASENAYPDKEELKKPVSSLMSPPVSAEIDFTLFHAAAIMTKYQLSDLPIVDHHGKLVGLLSHVDVGRGLIKQWHLKVRPLKQQE